jgi:hypothetical protein
VIKIWVLFRIAEPQIRIDTAKLPDKEVKRSEFDQEEQSDV